MIPEATFHCTHYACTLSIDACLRRQGASRQSATRGSRRGRVVTLRPKFDFCAGGTCPQGNAHAAQNAVPESIDPGAFRIGGAR